MGIAFAKLIEERRSLFHGQTLKFFYGIVPCCDQRIRVEPEDGDGCVGPLLLFLRALGICQDFSIGSEGEVGDAVLLQGRDRKLSVPLGLVAVLVIPCMLAGIARGAEVAIIKRFASVLRLGDYVGIADVVGPYRLKRNLQDFSLVVTGAYGASAKTADKSLLLQEGIAQGKANCLGNLAIGRLRILLLPLPEGLWLWLFLDMNHSPSILMRNSS